MARLPRPRFSLKSILLLSLGFALGYAWNLWVWRYQGLPGSEAKMVRLPTYVIEPPDILTIEVASNAAPSATPAVSGQHLVGMDGRVNLGKYGSVFVAGMTTAEAEAVIRNMLAGQIDKPQVVVDVHAYNSKVYYVVQQTGPLGNVIRLPITGHDTALDAIAQVDGLRITDAMDLWIARPAPNGIGSQTNIEIDYAAIAGGDAAKNPQILPGDRLFISHKQPAAQQSPGVQPAAAAMPPSRRESQINLAPYYGSAPPPQSPAK